MVTSRLVLSSASFSWSSTASYLWLPRRMPLRPFSVLRAARSTMQPTRPGCALTANLGENDKCGRAGRWPRSMFSTTAAPAEHSRIVVQRRRRVQHYLPELRMLWIDQPVVFIDRKGRGNQQQTSFRLVYELIADLGQGWRRRGFPPIHRQLASLNSFPRQTVRYIEIGRASCRERV